MAANKNLKARPKATPSRIQENISNDNVIIDGKVVTNDIVHIAETEALGVNDLPDGNISVPLNLWLENKAALAAREDLLAVQIAADEAPEDLSDDLAEITILVLPFVAHVDGRPYTHAQKLRERFGYTGQIRAVGDVKFDQLGFLKRVGCDAFELAEGENYHAALKAFDEFSDFYQPAADNARLVFSRRRAIH